jgi:hypothetical protein
MWPVRSGSFANRFEKKIVGHTVFLSLRVHGTVPCRNMDVLDALAGRALSGPVQPA